MEFRPSSADALRVSHDDRDRAVERLRTAFIEGRFDAAELEARLDRAMNAKTRGDLDDSLRDLPEIGTSVSLDSAPSPEPVPPTGAERCCAGAAHLLGWPTLFVGPGLIAAGAKSPYVREHAIEATNFQISFLGVTVALIMVTMLTLGMAGIAFPFLLLAWFGLTGIGGMAALVGNRFTYPWALRPLKP